MMDETIKTQIKKLTPLLRLHPEELAMSDLPMLGVSLFDHWLSEWEARRLSEISHAVAVTTGNVDAYLKGERRFLNLYRALSEGGVVIRGEQSFRLFEDYNDELGAILVASLREIRPVDVAFLGPEIRLIGGYERTDMMVAMAEERLHEVRWTVTVWGLFPLDVGEGSIVRH